MVLSSCSFSGNKKPTQDFYIVESLFTGVVTQIEHDGIIPFHLYKKGDTIIVNSYYDYENAFGIENRIYGFNSNHMIPSHTNEISFSDSGYYDSYERYVIKLHKSIPISLD
jgi:signal peptidase I